MTQATDSDPRGRAAKRIELNQLQKTKDEWMRALSTLESFFIVMCNRSVATGRAARAHGGDRARRALPRIA